MPSKAAKRCNGFLYSDTGPRTSRTEGKETDFQQHFHLGPEFPFRDERANAAENSRDDILRPRIDPDVLVPNPAEFHLLRANLPGHVLLPNDP